MDVTIERTAEEANVLAEVAKPFFEKFKEIAEKSGCIARVAKNGMSDTVRRSRLDEDTREVLIMPGTTEIDPTITVLNLYSFTKLSRAQRRIAQRKRN